MHKQVNKGSCIKVALPRYIQGTKEVQYQTQSYFLSGQVKELICDPLIKYSFYVFLNQLDDFSHSMKAETC